MTSRDKLKLAFPELEPTLTTQELKQAIQVVDNKASNALKIAQETQKMEGKPGYTPVKGTDYKDGENYTLTDSDKDEIASKIEVPIVEKIIEKTETIVKQPIVKEYTKEITIENHIEAKEIAEKLNTLKGKIDVSVIKGALTVKDLESQDKKVLDGMAKIDGRIKAVDQRWHGGGLSKVSTDSTLTGTGTPASPLSVVTSGGSNFRSITVTPAATITLAVNNVIETVSAIWTAGQAETINISGTAALGQQLRLEITAGGSFQAITLGTGFQSSSGLTFTIKALKTVSLWFFFDGTNFVENAGREPRLVTKMWQSTVASVPDDYVFCDGTNGTDDLRDKFVVGARQDSGGVAKTNVTGSLLQTGGSASHTHTAADGGHTHSNSTSFFDTQCIGQQCFPDFTITDVCYIEFECTDIGFANISISSITTVPPFFALPFIMKL